MATETTTIDAKLQRFAETVDKCSGQPSRHFLHDFRHRLTRALYSIPFDQEKGKHKLSGILLPEDKYVDKYGEPFPTYSAPGCYPQLLDSATVTSAASTEDIKKAADTLTDALTKREMSIHAAKKADWNVFSTARNSVREIILDKIDDVYYNELEDDDSGYEEVAPRTIFDLLERTSTGRHAIDVLELQDKMRVLHLATENVVDYIKALKDGQRQSGLISDKARFTDDNLLVWATNAMLSTGRFTKTNEDWENLPRDKQTWVEWQTLYKTADEREKTKTKALGGQDQFGSANAAQRRNGGPSGANAGAGVTMEALEDCFNDLANAAVTEKGVLDELVRANATLTATNAKLTASVDELTAANARLTKELGHKRGGRGNDTQREKKRCPNCKRDVFHVPDDCFELDKNKDKRPPGWKSCL